jgi:hypothetical protein
MPCVQEITVSFVTETVYIDPILETKIKHTCPGNKMENFNFSGKFSCGVCNSRNI